jgi:hypothetical protein
MFAFLSGPVKTESGKPAGSEKGSEGGREKSEERAPLRSRRPSGRSSRFPSRRSSWPSRTRIVVPTSPAPSAYVRAVALVTSAQCEPALSHRSHCYRYDVGPPNQLPVPAVSV